MYCPRGMSSSTRECEDIEDSSYSEDELAALCSHSSSSTGTLDSFGPYTGTMSPHSPMPSKRKTRNSKSKAGNVGPKNTTINVNNSHHMAIDFRTVVKNNVEQNQYKMPIMEKEVQEEGMKTGNMTAGPSNAFKPRKKSVPARERKILELMKKLTEQENENKYLKHKVAKLERQLQQYKEHVVSVAKQREIEKETDALKVKKLEVKVAELERELKTSEREVVEYKHSVVAMTKQRESEKETHALKVKKLEDEAAELERQLKISEKEVVEHKDSVVAMTKQRENEEKSHASSVKDFKDKFAELERQCKKSEEERFDWMEKAEELTHEKNFEVKSRRRFQNEAQNLKQEIIRKDQEIIRKDQEIAQLKQQMTRMNAVRAELAVLTTRSTNLRIHNFMLQDLVNILESRLEASEGREEEYRVLLGELRQVLDDIRNPPQAPNINDPQMLQEAVLPQNAILLLRCEFVSGGASPL